MAEVVAEPVAAAPVRVNPPHGTAANRLNPTNLS